MSTLTYTDGTFAPTAADAAKGAPKSRWRRLFDAFVESRQRRADREIARFLASHGGLLTDEMEREIMRRLAGNARRSR